MVTMYEPIRNNPMARFCKVTVSRAGVDLTVVNPSMIESTICRVNPASEWLVDSSTFRAANAITPSVRMALWVQSTVVAPS